MSVEAVLIFYIERRANMAKVMGKTMTGGSRHKLQKGVSFGVCRDHSCHELPELHKNYEEMNWMILIIREHA